MQQFLDTADSDSLRIIIDYRESKRFDDAFISLGAKVVRMSLDVGDFLCSARLVVERKERSDFEASIMDGRLFRQLENLKLNYERVVLLVEGEQSAGKIDRRALLGAYSSVVADYGTSVFFTRDLERSAELVFSMAKHEQMMRKQPMRVFARKKALNLSDYQRAAAESLPLIGPKMAKTLLEHFGSLKNLFQADERELLLVPGMGKKKARIIRKVISSDFTGSRTDSS